MMALQVCRECLSSRGKLDRTIKIRGNLDAGKSRASQIRKASPIFKGMDGQQVTLRAELEVKGVRRPALDVPAADEPRRISDHGLNKGRDSNWRKGV